VAPRFVSDEEVRVRLYAVGDRVSQPQYGDGTIVSANEYHTVIEFDEHGTRTFSTRLVRLERSSTAAPTKKPRPSRRTSHS
jgi:hypothetical protein